MPITYTNRNGVAYQLCRGTTTTGKVRYYFAREPRDAPVEELPDGYSIRESINGVVSLARDTPSQMLPAEVAAVEAAVRRHPHADRYRVDVRRDRIEIYERTGAHDAEIAAAIGLDGVDPRGMIEHPRAETERHARYAPVLRLTLMDEANRTFRVERWCYLGSIDDWITLMPTGPAEELARRLVPALGTDEFFELF